MTQAHNYWLLKTEPDTFSIDDLQKVKTEPWTGVRNYQARNFMKAMRVGDICLFYHSSCEVPGISGLCKVVKTNVVDQTQFNKKSDYYDPKSKTENPTWVCVEVEFVKKFNNVLPLETIKSKIKESVKIEKSLQNMRLMQKGSRLSVQPVTKQEYEQIMKLVENLQKKTTCLRYKW